jgi:long-chain acyl-CoA synthetase
MARDTLADFFVDLAAAEGEFLVHDDGYRSRAYSYREVAAAARGFAGRLHDAGLAKGDAVLIWGENRPEWIVAFWGAVLAGVVVVPVDVRSSAEFAGRVRDLVRARVVVAGDDVTDHPWTGTPPRLGDAEVWRLADVDWRDRRTPPPVRLAADDVAEIIFTSGATADPKGVLITHRNVLANLVPIEREVRKYRRWGRPFFPIRFLDLLPLSHLFGQAMATFIPPMLPGTTVFLRDLNPAEIVAQVKRRRVSVVVSVPKILEVLRAHVERTAPDAAADTARAEHVARRWWRYRRVHRDFGLKFWCFVVGAAPLDPAVEAFWSRLGFLVVQGYGLTETAPIVSLNHPFHSRRGSVGAPIPGVEVRIAPDGEILVRGDNVSRGYLGGATGDTPASGDGWLHTGDIGELDERGQLYVRGRKKEMIVTPEGLNVFPDDVERVLNRQPGVRESAVVGAGGGGRVHAVLVLAPGGDAEAAVRGANAELAGHQRVRTVSVWPGPELPRTEGTAKLKRREVGDWVEKGGAEAPRRGGDAIDTLLSRYAGARAVRADTTIEELGLSSLDRVELLVALEEKFGSNIDEARYAGTRTVGDLRSLLEGASGPSAAGRGAEAAWAMPAWSRSRAVRLVRELCLATWVLPLARVFARIRVEGRGHLDAIDGPVIFAANHQSHMDTPVILAALPPRWRRRVGVAMSKEFFEAHFHPSGHPWRERVTKGLWYYLALFFFNAFPLPQREAGARQALRHAGELVSSGTSVLIYPEGARTETGDVGAFRPGVGMIGARLSVCVVPVGLEGVDRVLHRSWVWPRRGPVRVAFGAPMTLAGDDYAALALRVEQSVRSLVTREPQYGTMFDTRR